VLSMFFLLIHAVPLSDLGKDMHFQSLCGAMPRNNNTFLIIVITTLSTLRGSKY